MCELAGNLEPREAQLGNENNRIREAVRRQGTLTNAMLQNLPVAAYLLDEDGRFLESVGAGLARLGCKDHQLNGQNAADVFPRIGKWIERALAGESVHFETQGHVDGAFWAFENLLTFDEVRGHGAVGFAIDITDRKRAERDVEKQRAELAHIARVRTVEEMASGISHELNQPLSVILAQAEVAAQKLRLGRAADTEGQIRELEEIASEADRAGQIIHRMRDFVRKTEPHRSSVHFAEVIREALVLVESDLRHAGIAIVCEVADSTPRILADRVQMRQVLLNLLLNAKEAIEQSQADVREIDIRVKPLERSLEVTVRDTGCGSSRDKTSQYFDNFFTTKPNGMGMGLAISRSIVEAHGGRIWAIPNTERGTTFTFTMPLPGGDPSDES